MNLDAHLRELNARHRELERTIEFEGRSPATDPARLSTLKKQKLHLKDEIVSLSERTRLRA